MSYDPPVPVSDETFSKPRHPMSESLFLKARFHEEARHTAFCPAETTDLVSARLKLQPPLFQVWRLSGKAYDLTSILVVIMRLP